MSQGEAGKDSGAGNLLAAIYIAKLDALRKLSVCLGWNTQHALLDPGHEDIAAFRRRGGWQIAKAAAIVLMSEEAHPTQKTAAAILLDILSPGWRDECPQLVGYAIDRADFRVKLWRDAVLERDGHRCLRCSSTDHLHAHHIVRWVDAPFLRIIVENGMTLCQDCHRDEHAKHAA
ncbi:hypothetical protein UAM5_00071 [Ralstonia phage UAM5]|nr:hypothetical protein UAM5_00071 [Ralstonia phage UAM5]